MPSIIDEDLSAPGVHVLVIGVSKYTHVNDGSDETDSGTSLGIGQLTTAAKSASEFAAWILNSYTHPYASLKSMRVLLSPSDDEVINSDIQDLLSTPYEATRENVNIALREFKSACDKYKDNIAIVYVAGHGVQLTKHGATVLLQDVGSKDHLNDLEGAIDVTGVHAGMYHPDTAQKQFWFIDACRQRPEIADKFETMEGALTLSTPRGAAEASIIYLATTTEKQAFAIPGDVSLFYKALSWALVQKGAAEGADNNSTEWQVTVNSLNNFLPIKVKEYANEYEEEQHVEITGNISNIVFHKYKQIPKSELTLSLNPVTAHSTAIGDLSYDASQIIISGNTHWPLVKNIKSGIYLAEVQATSSAPIKRSWVKVMPPSTKNCINL